MRKLFLLLVFAFNITSAQEVYETYSKGGVSVSVKPGRSQGKMYLDIKEVGIVLTSKDRSEFLTFLQKSYDKYTEWVKIAEKNSVQELNKDIKTVDFKGYFMYGSKWKFSTAKLRAIISIKDGKNSCYVYIAKMKANDNQYMKSESTLLYITPEIIAEFTSFLNEEKINKFIASGNSVDALFKN